MRGRSTCERLLRQLFEEEGQRTAVAFLNGSTLPVRASGVGCVFGGLVFGGFSRVVFSLHMVAMRQMSVMARLLVFACLVVLCGS